MDKRDKADLLALIGLPATISITVIASDISRPSLHWLWAIPLAVVSLPLLPIALKSEQLLRECRKEDFLCKNFHLPHVYLPKEYAYIEAGENDDWLAQPFYYMDEAEPFELLKEVRQFLLDKDYQEVVALNYPNSLETYWIKKENDV